MINEESAIYNSYIENDHDIFVEVDFSIEEDSIVLDTRNIFKYKIYFDKKKTYYDDISYGLKSTNEKWTDEKLYKWSSKYNYNKEELKRITRSSKSIKQMNKDKLEYMLKKDGYTNIVLSPIYDVVFGIFSSVGDIDRVAIDGETKFDSYLDYPNDTEIKIYYHEDSSLDTEND